MKDMQHNEETDYRCHSDFSLLCETDAETCKVDKMIWTALKKCVARINEISEKYPRAGIGDTATDEEIATEFYSLLH